MKVTTQMYHDMVEYVLSTLPWDDRSELLAVTEKSELVRYHHTLGRWIRNHFGLWALTWVPVIVNGFDVSENNPEQLSMRVIEAVWERLQNAENSTDTITIHPLKRN